MKLSKNTNNEKQISDEFLLSKEFEAKDIKSYQ